MLLYVFCQLSAVGEKEHGKQEPCKEVFMLVISSFHAGKHTLRQGMTLGFRGTGVASDLAAGSTVVRNIPCTLFTWLKT